MGITVITYSFGEVYHQFMVGNFVLWRGIENFQYRYTLIVCEKQYVKMFITTYVPRELRTTGT